MLAANFLQSDLLKPDSHWTTQDCQMMARALQLAKKGKYTARPNPQVGSVLVKDGKIIGEGYHQTFGQAHAEINALKMAGNEAKGATCYVTLEPCAHTGKTGPCSQALVDAGVKRVVAAMADPNPQVAGKGFKILQDAGIKVEFGLMQSQAQNLNSGFISQMTRKRPWVTCKLAMSVDGRTALANGESKWITGSAARADVQKLRAKQDAIITGIGTLLADDPSLNIRLEDSGYPQDQWLIKAKEKGFKPPVKILLDTQAKAPLKSKLFIKDKESTTEKQVIWFANNHVKQNLPEHILLKPMPSQLQDFLFQCDELGFNQVLLECGHKLAGGFLANGLIDELVVYMAPKLMGSKGMGLFELNIESMDNTHSLKLKDVRHLGDDIRLTYEV